MANRLAHLPRVQAPVHTVNMLNGVPGVHHKRRPQDMTKTTQNTQNYFKRTEQANKQSNLAQNTKYMKSFFNKN